MRRSAVAGSTERFPPPIRGLELLQEIRRTGDAVVYRARRGGREYAVRVHRGRTSADSSAYDRFRRDAAVHATLDHPLIPTSYDVGLSEGRPYVVGEYVEGATLPEWLDGEPLSESMAVVLAGALAGALAQIHARGLLHGELGPTNVVLTDDGEIKLVDGGLVRRRGGACASGGSDSREGRPYLAPEQREGSLGPVDGRADLYALGALLRDGIAGRVGADDADPVDAGGPLETVVDQVDPVFGAILARLLVREPEERYQSARRLKADLDRLDRLDERHAAGRPLELGVLAVGREEVAGDAFVGRAEELQYFESIWQGIGETGDRGGRRSGDQGEAILVTGAGGSGKTRLLREVCSEVVGTEDRIIRGRCASANPRPFAPLRAGLERYVRRLEAVRGPGERGPADLLAEAAGSFQGVLGAISPTLREMFGSENDVVVARDAHEVFYNAYASLFIRLSEILGGLLLWIDDAQRVDAATFDVLRRIGTRSEAPPLLLVCTARDGAAHRETVERLRADIVGSDGSELRLEPFGASDVGRLVGARLGERRVDGEFVEALARQSRGNPFLLDQQLQTLQDGGMLSPGWDSWVVDEQAFRGIGGSDDPDAWIERRFAAMGAEIRRVLTVGALLGECFSLGLIRAVSREVSESVVDAAIREGIEARFLNRRSEDGKYAFAHDRIREVLADRVDAKGAEASVRRRAAEYLDRLDEATGAEIYARARHYLAASSDLGEPDVAAAVWQAGRRAADAYAFEEAYRFLHELEQAGAGAHAADDPAAFYERMGRVCFRTDRLEEAVGHFEAGLDRVEEPLRRADIRSDMARARSRALDEPGARRQAAEAFDELDVRLPTRRWNSKAVALLWIAGRWFYTWLLLLTGIGRGSADGDDRRRNRALVNLFDVGFHVGYYSRDKLFILQSAVYGLLPAHYLGDTREYSVGFVIYSVTLALLGFEEAAASYGRRALRCAERVADRKTLAFTRQMYSAMKSVCGELEESMQIERELLRADPEWLDTATYNLVCIDLATTHLLRGNAREGFAVTRAGLRQMRGREGGLWSVYKTLFWARLAAFASLLGAFDRADRYRAKAFETGASIDPDRALPWVATWGLIALDAVERDALERGFEPALAEHATFEIPAARSIRHTHHAYVAKAYGRLAQCTQAAAVDEELLGALDDAIEELDAADSKPLLEGHRLAVHGGRDRLAGDWDAAQRRLQRAIDLGESCENRWAQFAAHREWARLLADRRREGAARERAEVAMEIAVEAGWRGRIASLAAEFDLAFPDAASGDGLEPDFDWPDPELESVRARPFVEREWSSPAEETEGGVEVAPSVSVETRGSTDWRRAFLEQLRGRISFDRGAVVSTSRPDQSITSGGSPSLAPTDALRWWRGVEGEPSEAPELPAPRPTREAGALLVIPLSDSGTLSGLAVVERADDEPFSDREIERALAAGTDLDPP